MFQWSSNRRTAEGSATSTYPGQRAAAIQGSIRPPDITRAQHLESYLNDPTLQRSTRRIPPGDSVYDTVFQTVAGDTLILRVRIENERLPTMLLAGVQARHAWLDSKMHVVGYPPLRSEATWRDSRMLLGAAVHQVVQEFQLRPPEIIQILDPNLNNIQKRETQQQQQPPPPPPPPQQQRQKDAPPEYREVLGSPSIDMPVTPTRFDELEKLDREALDRLMEDELEFQAFCNRLPTLKTLQSMATSVLDDNVKVAEENLKHEGELKQLNEQAKELQTKLKQSVREFLELEKKQDKLCQPPDRRKITRELVKAKKEAFDKSEQVAEAWLENEAANVDDFVRNFMDIRITHHRRAAKLEMLEFMSGSATSTSPKR